MCEQTNTIVAKIVRTLKGLGDSPPVAERGDVFSLRLGRFAAAVGLARHELYRWLVGHGVGEADARDVVLACSEACANAVEHASRPARYAFDLEARIRNGTIEVLVRDFGCWDGAESPGPDRGRGLVLIGLLMDEYEITPLPDATEIRMRRSVPREPAAVSDYRR